ncbi:hypothetical protein PENTCL1PPCAC_12753, partial [Pristionchus entomophagus]
FTLCGLSIRPAVTALTIVQILASLLLGLSYNFCLTDLGTIITIVMGIHIFCAGLATIFLLFVALGELIFDLFD